jgi:hypothetical protein
VEPSGSYTPRQALLLALIIPNPKKMLDQYQAPVYIAGRLSQLKMSDKDIYQSMQALTDYTKRMALAHDFKMVERCLQLVEMVYEKGTALVKNAVENVFIFSFSSMRMQCNIVEWRMVQSYMPAGLYALYLQQVLRSKD